MIARITLPRYAISAEQELCVILGKVHARKVSFRHHLGRLAGAGQC